MYVVVVLALSILLQATAAFLALRLIWVTGRRLAWVIIAVAFVIMALRRAITLFRPMIGAEWNYLDLTAELVALGVSIILVVGVAAIAPLFRSIVSSEKELTARARQQASVLALGQMALSGMELETLLDEAVAQVTATLGVDRCQVLELQEDWSSLVPKAGVGWTDGAPMPTGIQTGRPPGSVARDERSDHAAAEDTSTDMLFELPAVLGAEDVAGGANVTIHGPERPYGTLRVHSTEGRLLTTDDINYLQAVGNVLAEAIERGRAEQSVKRSEERFRMLIENALDLITIVTADGTIRYQSPSSKRMLGYDPVQLSQRSMFDFLHHDDYEVMKGALERAAADKGSVQSAVVRFQHADESWRVLEAVCTVVRETGDSLRLVVNARDNTERKELEEKLHQSQQLEAVGRLAGGVAHDFNNLLTVISGYSEQVIYGLEDEDPVLQDLEVIADAATRAGELTRRLLAFGRRQILSPKVMSLNESVRDIEKLLRSTVGEGVELVSILDPKLGRISADPGQMDQVLVNLAANARDAMPKGGRLEINTANVTFEEDREGGLVQKGRYVKLQVRDTGLGMTEEVRRHVFEPFFTTKELGKGTGLGLATVYGIVRQSGGYIRVDSSVGEGTVFEILFPRTNIPAEEITRRQDRDPTAIPRGTEAILVVEDDDPLRALTVRILRSLGYTVHEARHPGEALLKSEGLEGSLDLVLTDVVMPEMNGPELARRIRERGTTARILYMTGHAEALADEHGPPVEERQILNKPFTAADLGRKVRDVLS
ncbi:ATP-binding protein [Planctomycetota bacterium]